MHGATWDLDLPRISEPQVATAHDLRRGIAGLQLIRSRVQEHWFELAPDERTGILKIVDEIKERLRAAEARSDRSRKRDLFAAFWTGVRALFVTTVSHGANTRLIFTLAMETVNLLNSVSVALSAECEVEKTVLDRVIIEQNFLAEGAIAKARAEYANGSFVTMTPAELRDRAQRKADRERKAQAEA